MGVVSERAVLRACQAGQVMGWRVARKPKPMVVSVSPGARAMGGERAAVARPAGWVALLSPGVWLSRGTRMGVATGRVARGLPGAKAVSGMRRW